MGFEKKLQTVQICRTHLCRKFVMQYFKTLLCSYGQNIMYRPDILTAELIETLHYFTGQMERIIYPLKRSNTRLR